MSDGPLITTKQGVLRGKCDKTAKGFNFFAFQAIPYAKPPTGDLRFKAPQAPEPWQGVRDATSDANPCLQKNTFLNITEGSDDCLFLNVYTAQLPQENSESVLKPVMVWVHGGAFTTGSNRRDFYDPAYLIDKDVVLVIINYRLGALGFLSLQDPKLGVSGNAGLKDQVMALKWVQANIHAFGGDPNNVTVFGESAGSAAVSYLLLSPMTKGLFHKAILQSGVATCSWAEGSTDGARELLKALGKTATSEAEMLKILQEASTDELLAAQLIVPDTWKPSERRYLSPTVENCTNNEEEVFLPDEPMNIIKSGCYNKVPVIIGCTSNEGLLIKFIEKNVKKDLTPVTDEEFVPYTLGLEKGSAKKIEIGKKIKEFYYGNEKQSNENRQCFFNFIADVYFNRALLDVVENTMKTSSEKVYLYMFSLESNLSGFKNMFNASQYKGACHGEDLFCLFKTMMTTPFEENGIEDIAVQRMTTWWTNFAKYSDPNGVDNNPLLSVKWPVATTNMEYLDIDKDLQVKDNLEGKMNEFWKAVEAECE